MTMNPTRTKLLILTIFLLSFSIIALEYLKHLFFPVLPIWQSHLITLAFVIIVMTVVTLMIHGFVRKLDSQMSRKQVEKSKLESALQSSEERYRAIFENSSSAIVLLDADTMGNFDFNSRANELLGFTHLEFEKLNVKDYELAPLSEIRSRFDRILKSGLSDRHEARYRRKGGEFIDVFVNARTLSFEGRKYFLLVWDDISEKKRIQTRVFEQFDFLATLMETISIPLFYKDRQGRYTGCNKAFEDFFGMSKAEIIGKTVFDVGPPDIAEKYFKMDEELFNKPGKQVYEWKVKTRRHGLRDVIFNKATFKDIKGSVNGLVGAILDITDLKKAEVEIQNSRDALIAQNKILVEWTSPEILYRPDFECIMTRITEMASRIFKVARVGIWLFNTDFTRLYCADLYDARSAGHVHDLELAIKDFPSYFKAIRNERVIVCRNASGDPRYGDFLESYIKPLKIASLLDVPVYVSGEIIGVICIEHCGEPREWSIEEQNFALSLGNLFSLSLEKSRHRHLEESMKIARDNFVNVIEKLPCPLLIVDSKKRLKFVNSASEKFFGQKIKDMLGAEFPYPVVAGRTAEIDLRGADGKMSKVRMTAVGTMWENEPALLVTLLENPSEL